MLPPRLWRRKRKDGKEQSFFSTFIFYHDVNKIRLLAQGHLSKRNYLFRESAICEHAKEFGSKGEALSPKLSPDGLPSSNCKTHGASRRQQKAGGIWFSSSKSNTDNPDRETEKKILEEVSKKVLSDLHFLRRQVVYRKQAMMFLGEFGESTKVGR